MDLKDIPHSRIEALHFLKKYLLKNNVEGMKVADIPSGSGYISKLFTVAGAQVFSYDISHELSVGDGNNFYLDITKPFKLEESSFDLVLHNETFEHLPNQLFTLGEMKKLLKPGGKIILTTPNSSKINSRVAFLLFESERTKLLPPNITDSIISNHSGGIYYNRIFRSGIQHINNLANLNGLRISKIHNNTISWSAVLYGIVLLPFIFLSSSFTFLKYYSRLNNQINKEKLKEIWLLNINFKILFCKHLCLELKAFVI